MSENPYAEVFRELTQVWAKITKKKVHIQTDALEGLDEEIKELALAVEELEKSSQEMQKASGLTNEPVEKFIFDNKEKFSDKDLRLFRQMTQMKMEIISLQEALKLAEREKEKDAKLERIRELSQTGKEEPPTINEKLENQPEELMQQMRKQKQLKRFADRQANKKWLQM